MKHRNRKSSAKSTVYIAALWLTLLAAAGGNILPVAVSTQFIWLIIIYIFQLGDMLPVVRLGASPYLGKA